LLNKKAREDLFACQEQKMPTNEMIIFAPLFLMPRYFIKLSYNGTNYHGWQAQKNTPLTIQQILNERASKIMGAPLEFTGCGRTDTGVHATCYYAHFDAAQNDLHLNATDLTHKLNSFLPNDIVVYSIYKCVEDANCRFDAEARTYQYWITQQADAFALNRAFHVREQLDIELMNEACQLLKKHTDFSCFCKSHANSKTSLCTITDAYWQIRQPASDSLPIGSCKLLVFEITANRFLRNMVRAIVGTMLDIGKQKTGLAQFEKILRSKNRSNAGASVPASGLYLTNVGYPKRLFLS
jgi:tRNA pseudouridine38-40 synthase